MTEPREDMPTSVKTTIAICAFVVMQLVTVAWFANAMSIQSERNRVRFEHVMDVLIEIRDHTENLERRR